MGNGDKGEGVFWTEASRKYRRKYADGYFI